MRKVIFFNMVSLDGFFEGPGRNIDWHNTDEEFEKYSVDQLDTAGALLFGRVTYELMESFWPTTGLKEDPAVAERMNALPKFVFSKTLEKADWNNTRLVRGDAVDEVTRLKQQPGKDLFLFGSADLARTFIQHDLIDEFRVIVNPILLGKGTPLFQGIDQPVRLHLSSARTFQNGNVLLVYQTDK